MAVPVVESITVSDQHAGNDTTLTVNMPDTRPDGDMYIAFCMKDDDPDWTGVPGNWITAFNVINNQERHHVWYWVGSSEPASYTLTMDNEIGVAVVAHISGQNGSQELDVSPTGGSDAGSANAQAFNITPVTNETLIFTSIAVDTALVSAVPSGMTLAAIGGDGGSGDIGFGVAYEDGPAADSPTTLGTWTHGSDSWAAGTLAVRSQILKTNEVLSALSEGALGQRNFYAGPFEID